MRWIRRIFVVFCLVATCLIVWAAIFARQSGFTESWITAIEREFLNRGYHVNIEKITLGAFRGLVAENVTFYEGPQRIQEIASLDDVYLDVDLSRIFSKEVSVNTLDVEDASLSLPLDPANPNGGRRLRVENLSGRVVITESMIEIVKAEAEVSNFDLEIKGSLLRAPEDDGEEGKGARKKETDETLSQWRRTIQGVLREVEKFEFPGERPRIAVEFRSDLDDLATTTAKARLSAGTVRRKGRTYEISELRARVQFDGFTQKATLDEFLLRDDSGEMNLTGSWSGEGNLFEFETESGVDLASLVGLFWRDRLFKEVVFFESPRITANGHVDIDRIGEDSGGFPGEVLGEFQAERFVSRGTVFEGLNAGFSVADDRFYVRNLRLDHQSGVAFLNLKSEPESGEASVQYQAEVKLDPNVFRPFLPEGGRKFLDAWGFDDSSTVYFAAAGSGASWDPGTWTNQGVIDLRNFRLKGVPFLEMEADFESRGPQHWFREVALVREEGRIVAEMAQFDPVAKIWNVKGVTSTVELVEGARAFNEKLAEALSRYRFEEPPTVRLSGQLDARRQEEVGDEPRRNELEISFETDSPASYTFLGKPLTAGHSSGEIAVSGSRVHLRNLRAGVFGGNLELEYDAKNVRSPARPFDATLRVGGMPLEAITALYGSTRKARGTVGGIFHLSGNAGDVSSLNGHGTAEVTEGNLFAIPLLGPLSRKIDEEEGGDAGPNIVREARAVFEVRNGVIHSEECEALTDSFRVRAAGTVSLVDKSVDFEAAVNTKGGLSSAVLTPVSELLTFSCTGTVSEPVWKAKHISNLGKLPAQVITELAEIPVGGLRMLGQGIFGNREEKNGAATPEPARPETGGARKAPEAKGEGRSKLFPLLPLGNRKGGAKE